MKTATRLSSMFQCEVQILDESLSFLSINRLSIFSLLSLSCFFRNEPVCLETTFLLPIDVYVLRLKLKISFTFFRQSFIIFMTQCTYLRRLTQSGSHKTHKKCVYPLWRNVDMKVEFFLNKQFYHRSMNDNSRELYTQH